MRIALIILSLLFVMVTAMAEDNPRVTRLMDSFSSSASAAEEAYQEAMRKAEEERLQALTTARDRTITGLKRLVRPRGDVRDQAEIYKQILRLDSSDKDAVGFFTAIGTLEQVLADIEPVVETDLLGNVVGVADDVAQGNLNVRHLTVRSAGYDDGNYAYIAVAGNPIIDKSGTAGRGVNAAAITPQGELLWARTYDTFANAADTQRFINDVQELPRGTAVIIATGDEASGNWAPSGDEVLRSLGGSDGIRAAGHRGSYLLIGRVGLGAGNGIEMVSRRHQGAVQFPPKE
ncbi:MAG: hypothetical protein EA401_00380 [Planctomycetota bacterium]|nr:MAG: hypothetical protein EA401_00380 [Planctomycetota bacterium]